MAQSPMACRATLVRDSVVERVRKLHTALFDLRFRLRPRHGASGRCKGAPAAESPRVDGAPLLSGSYLAPEGVGHQQVVLAEKLDVDVAGVRAAEVAVCLEAGLLVGPRDLVTSVLDLGEDRVP